MEWILDHIKEIMLLLFVAVFLGIIWWAYKPANKQAMKSHGDIPFKGDEEGKNDRY